MLDVENELQPIRNKTNVREREREREETNTLESSGPELRLQGSHSDERRRNGGRGRSGVDAGAGVSYPPEPGLPQPNAAGAQPQPQPGGAFDAAAGRAATGAVADGFVGRLGSLSGQQNPTKFVSFSFFFCEASWIFRCTVEAHFRFARFFFSSSSLFS